jgi:hypothetical protein
MAHGPEARAAVRAAYVHQALPIEQAARQCGVPEATARNWKAKARRGGDDWDRARAASYMSGQGSDTVMMSVLQSILILTQSTLADLETAQIDPLERVEAISRLTDAYHKTSAAISRGSPKLSRLAMAMEILEKLVEFVRTQHPQHAAALLTVLEPFGAELARAYS